MGLRIDKLVACEAEASMYSDPFTVLSSPGFLNSGQEVSITWFNSSFITTGFRYEFDCENLPYSMVSYTEKDAY